MSLKLNLTYGDETFTFDNIEGRVQSLTLKCKDKLMNSNIIIYCEEVIIDELEYTLTINAQATSIYGDYGNYAIKLNSAPTSNDDYDYKASDIAGTTCTAKAVSYYKWNVNAGNGWENATCITLTSDTHITITYCGGGGAVD